MERFEQPMLTSALEERRVEAVEGVGEEAYRAAGTALGGPGARFTAWADGIDVGVTVYSDVAQEVSFATARAIAEDLLAQTAD